MALGAFLYRRFCRWVTCELNLPTGGRLALRSKYDVASCSDVFCHPFYWAALSTLIAPPDHVVDCGACCGHFSVLADIFLKSRFGALETEFTLIDANPLAIPVLTQNLADAGLLSRARVVHSILGAACSSPASLWVERRNWLTASTHPRPGAREFRVPTCTLASLAGKGPAEVLKIDIEGAEHQLLVREHEVFRRATLVLAELHGSTHEKQRFIERCRELGLRLQGTPFEHADHLLAAFAR